MLSSTDFNPPLLGLQGRRGCVGLAPPWASHALGAPGHLFHLTGTSPPTACLQLRMEKPWLLLRLHFSMEVFLPGAFDLSNQARETAPLRHPFHPHSCHGLGFKRWGPSRSLGLQLQGYCGTKGTTSPAFPGIQQVWSKEWWEKAQLPPARPTREAHCWTEPAVRTQRSSP